MMFVLPWSDSSRMVSVLLKRDSLLMDPPLSFCLLLYCGATALHFNKQVLHAGSKYCGTDRRQLLMDQHSCGAVFWHAVQSKVCFNVYRLC